MVSLRNMEGVTTAIVGFIFVCVVYPRLVKNQAQFYTAVVGVLIIILINAFGLMFEPGAVRTVIGVMTGLLQVCGIVLLILSAGGLSVKELTGEIAGAYEVIRRGETEKTVIIPLTGEQPKPRPEAHADAVERIATAEASKPKPAKPDTSTSIPLD
jgi:hypothetical protein